MSYRNCSERTNYVRCIVQWISIAVRSAANHCTNTLCSNVRSGPGSVVGTTTGYGLDAPGIDTVTDIPKNLTFVKSVHHHHTIKIIQTRRCRSFTSLLLDVYVWLQMFRASPRPSSGAYNCTRSLWFNRWSTAAGALLVVLCQLTVFSSHLVSTLVLLFHSLEVQGSNLNPDCLNSGVFSDVTGNWRHRALIWPKQLLCSAVRFITTAHIVQCVYCRYR